MAKIGSLEYEIGIKGEKNAIESLKRVQDAASKTKESGAAHGSDLKGAFGSMASAIRESLIDSIWKNISAGKNASVIGGIGGIFEQAVNKGVKAGLIKTRGDVAALYEVTSGKEAAAALNALAKSKSATAQQQKKQVIGSRETQESAIDLQKQKSELQARRMQLRSEAQAIESRRGGTAAARQREAAPLHAESMRLAGFIKEIDKKLNDPASSAAEERLLRRQREAKDRLNSKRYSGNRDAVGEQGPQPAGLGRANWGEEELVAFEKQFNKLSRKTKTAVARFKTEVVSGVTDLPLNRWLKTQEESDAIAEREQLRQERLSARRARRGHLSDRLQQSMGLPIGAIGLMGQPVFGVGAKPQLSPYVAPPPIIPPQMHGPDLPPPLPMPWLYRVNDRMSLRGHRGLSDRAGRASALSDEITNQVLDHRINTELAAARAEVRAAQADQRVASVAGDPIAMQAANQRLNAAQNDLLDTEERRRFVASEHSDIIRDVNAYLRTQVTLEEKIASAEQAAVNYARQRNQNMTAAEEDAVRQRARQGIVNRTAHGGTTAAKYEQERDSLLARAEEQQQYIRSAAGQNDPVAREYSRALNSAFRIRNEQAANEARMAAIRESRGGSAPSAFNMSGEAREYRRLESRNNRLNREMEKYNQVLHGIGNASKRWNYQLLELGYGVQDFTQVLAGGGGLSAALRGASNNLSQFFAAGGGKNAALWATGIGVGALAIGMVLDSITKQSKEAAENLDTVRKSADRLSTLNLKVLSGVNSASLDALNPDIMSNRESGAFNRRAGAESASAALDEIRYQNKTSSIFTPIADFFSEISADASGFIAKSRGLTYYETEKEKGRFSSSAEIRDAEEVLAARISGRKLGREYRSQFGSDLGKMDIDEALEKLAKSGSLMADPLRDAYNKKKEGESQKRISDFEFNENMKNYKTQTSMWSIGSGRSETARYAEMLIKGDELEKRNEFLRNEKINNKLTPESKAAYAQEIRRNQERIDAINERRKKTAYNANVASVNGQSASGMSMESALDEYLSKKLENKLASLAESPIEASVMEAAMRQIASSYSPSQMQGESLTDFSSRVVVEMNHQFEMIDKAAKESGRNLDYLKDRIGSLGRVAIDIAKAMEARDKAIAGTVGMDNYSSDEIKQMAAVEEELAKKKAENEKKYFNTDKTLMHHLDAVAEEEADRNKNRIRIQRVQSEFADKTMMAGNVASFLGGREGAKLNTEMEYDQRIAAIESSNLDRAQKDSAIGVAKDLREAELEKIDRKNVSFTDVGSMWKTIQGSLQGDNKKILNHWKTYMDLVRGEGIRVKLNIGT